MTQFDQNAHPDERTVMKVARREHQPPRRQQQQRTRRTPAPVAVIKVDRRVMAAARKAIRPGQRLVIVDAETVRLVNEVA